jgi:hypothetical protein
MVALRNFANTRKNVHVFISTNELDLKGEVTEEMAHIDEKFYGLYSSARITGGSLNQEG